MSYEYEQLVAALMGAAVILGLMGLLGTIVYLLLSLPYERQERARLFVDLLDSELRLGHAPEPALIRLAQCQDASLSVRFFILAAWLEQGLKLDEALAKVPRFLPPGVTAIIQTGCRLGSLQQVLPACRYQLQAAADEVSKTRNYLALTLMVFFPVWLAALAMINVFILPRIKAIAAEMVPEFNTPWMIDRLDHWLPLTAIPICLLALGALASIAGPRLELILKRALPGHWVDGFLNLLPWNNRRARRDFSLTLSLLLDAGFPEEQAVLHAGAATGNERFRRVAERAATELRKGARLPEALERIDAGPELRWRWQTAVQAHASFASALAGWHESLNAQAVKSEQAASNLVTTALVVLNGLLVGLVVIGIFQFITVIIEEASLW